MASKIPARPMEYPYSLVNKVTHFPWKMHYNHANWRFKWVVIGYVVTAPLFVYLHKALNSPGNQEKLRITKAKEHREHLEHLKHLK
ncbi:hypothetical protein ONE63_001304 [Megalurothrips usitatus]|uniref:Complex I-B15 n=1 Tax=Megalurothrips usitatus TaxID=439358 RepID=A0AAV7XFH9_9NEOP|nr:hypothetical protein ONE63_001304 [Megalurothrips usitatus]